MMLSSRVDTEHWGRRLAALGERYGVPGSALGIMAGDEVAEAAHGVLNVDTGVEATTDSLFQIGSITKVWTATLVMQLVDDGALDLDGPVVDVLPELVLADQDTTARVTMRHLLTHASGIDGDLFVDTGRGDDCLARYVTELRDAAQNHPLGATVSYSNAGFILAGRVIEKVTGMTWDAALRSRILEPLGLTSTVTLPEEALRFRTAIGHEDEPGVTSHPVAVWGLMRSVAPAGLICSTTADVLTFVRMHLSGGCAAGGDRVLADAGVAAMQQPQVEVPGSYPPGDARGLGWRLYAYDGGRLVGHDGNVRGQSAFLRIVPDQRLAVVLLTNGGRSGELYQDLFREVLGELAGVDLPRSVEPPTRSPAVDLAAYAGRYERASTLLECFERDGGLVLRQTVTGALASLAEEPVKEYPLMPVRDDLFAIREPGEATWQPVTFYRLADGSSYIHMGGRATPKTASVGSRPIAHDPTDA